MALSKWKIVSVHEVVLEWLCAERAKVENRLEQILPSLWAPLGVSKLLDDPDLENPLENRARLRLLYLYRNTNLIELPLDTKWYRVQSLRDKDLHRLHLFPNGDPIGEECAYTLTEMAPRLPPGPLNTEPDKWRQPILFGHDKTGDFGILEGNNRLTAYVQSQQSNLNIPVLIGLSPMKYAFNYLDHCAPIAFLQ
jgi:hypothetical protein